MSNRNRLLILNYTLLLLTLLTYFYLGFSRALPENITALQNRRQQGGATPTNVVMIFKYAEYVHESADHSALDLAEHLVYRGHNPGLFRLLAVWLYEAGLRSMLALQMIPLALSVAALVLLYTLVRSLFGDAWIALFAVAYAAFCPSSLVFASSLGATAYGKFFQLATLVAFLGYLRKNRAWLLGITFLSYFLACWNYWEYYVGTAILLLGLHYVERRSLFSRSLAIALAAPFVAVLSFLPFVATRQGGLIEALYRVYSTVAYRIFDQVPAASYLAERSESGEYLDLAVLGRYLNLISLRVEQWYYLSPGVLALMLAAVLFAHPKARHNAYKFFYFLVPASFYWSFLMIQHTVIHSYTAADYYMGIALIFACFVREVPTYIATRLEGRPFKNAIAMLVLVPVLLPVVGGMAANILPKQRNYLERTRNAAEEVGEPGETAPTQKRRAKRHRKRLPVRAESEPGAATDH
jgi:hypothetical protein